MNTLSLVINGRTASDISLIPARQRSSLTTLPTRKSLSRTFSDLSTFSLGEPATSAPPSPMLSGQSTPRPSTAGSMRPGSSGSWHPFSRSGSMTPTLRPGSSRSSSKGSPGWYNTENNLTLDDFARKLNTRAKRFEIWQGRCAQNVVMALLRPTPLVLFLLNPLCLILYVVLAVYWLSSGSGSVEG